MCLQGLDDITGEPLIQQEDDRPEALVARLRHYKDVAKPVIDFYKYAHKTFIGITSHFGMQSKTHPVCLWLCFYDSESNERMTCVMCTFYIVY